MTIINSPHILLCSRGKLCLQATLFTFMSEEEEEEEKNPAVFKKKKNVEGERGEKEEEEEEKENVGAGIMGPTQSAATFRLVLELNGTSHSPLHPPATTHPTTTLVFVLAPLLPRLPSLTPPAHPPSSTVFLGEQRGPVALAAPHSIADHSSFFFPHFCFILSCRHESLEISGRASSGFNAERLVMLTGTTSGDGGLGFSVMEVFF